MKRSILLLALLLASPAAAQQPLTANVLGQVQMPASSVLGNSLPVPGGLNAIPFVTLSQQFLTSLNGGNVTNTMLANVPSDTVKCNPTAGTGPPQDCTSPIVSFLTANNNVTTGGALAFSGGIANTPASTSLLSQLSSVSGSDSTHVAVAYNYINVSSDSAVLTGGGNGTFGALLYAILNFGNSTSMRGGRTAVQGVLTQQGTTGNNGPLQGFQPFYISGGFSVEGKFNDNGTGVTSTTASGSITGVNGIAVLDNTATNFYNIQGAEFDVAIASGASSFRKEGVLIAQLSNDAVHGADEGALVFGNQPGAIGWNTLIKIGVNQTGLGALTTTGTVMKCGGNCGTIGSGIDLSAFTITNFAFKSPGFGVDGQANITTTGDVGVGVTTFAGLPTCNAGIRGHHRFITDYNGAGTWHNTAIGGGAIPIAVVCDGSIWYID